MLKIEEVVKVRIEICEIREEVREVWISSDPSPTDFEDWYVLSLEDVPEELLKELLENPTLFSFEERDGIITIFKEGREVFSTL
ncbi:hypothetical protein J7J18_04340 [bacterium]|nr:hypothetical protein [bacterium]